MSADATTFELYVAGRSVRSSTARVNLERICAEAYRDGYEVKLIDVFADPELAERASILATPTVIRQVPNRELRVVGDLSDAAAAVAALEIERG